jgi:hypothetical protein
MMTHSRCETTFLDSPADRPAPAVRRDVAVPPVGSGGDSGPFVLAAHSDVVAVLVWQLRLANRRPWDTSGPMVQRLLAGLRADQEKADTSRP